MSVLFWMVGLSNVGDTTTKVSWATELENIPQPPLQSMESPMLLKSLADMGILVPYWMMSLSNVGVMETMVN